LGYYWVRFARPGNPNGRGAANWPATTTAPTTYLHIGDAMRIERLSPDRERVKALSVAPAIKGWAAAPKP
jgi:carboxylesterase type B